MSVTNEMALCEGLRHIAHCLEVDSVYLPSTDQEVHGDAAKSLLIDFARKLAGGKTLENWRKWCERRIASNTSAT